MPKPSVSKPEFRHRVDIPLPPIEEIEHRLIDVLTPSAFAPLRHADPQVKRRDRLLTLPVMTALVVNLVWRRIPSVTEVLRVLAREGLLWVQALRVSKQAVSQRLATLPACLFAQVFADVLERLAQRPRPPRPPEPAAWQAGLERFEAVWIADGSTLEALRKRVEQLKGPGRVLGGKMLLLVEAFTHRPIAAWYTTDAQANEKTWADALLARLPVGGLLIFDLGFFSFLWFDAFTDAQKAFVTRLRQKTAYRVRRMLSQGPRYCDALIALGQYRSNPCQHPVRLVSVLWRGTWYHYLTNVLDPQVLTPQQVCELYRRRWRIEDAFLLTKRLLGLSYLWGTSPNGVEIQLYATWIFYAVLTDLCHEVAQALGQPLERISVEMVFRGLYHFSRAVHTGEATDVVVFLAAEAKLLGLVKALRKRHRQIQQTQQELWETTLS